MDTHNKRLNYINRFNLGHVGLTPNGTVEDQDVKNYIWLPFFFIYPSPVPPDPQVSRLKRFRSILRTGINTGL